MRDQPEPKRPMRQRRADSDDTAAATLIRQSRALRRAVMANLTSYNRAVAAAASHVEERRDAACRVRIERGRNEGDADC